MRSADAETLGTIITILHPTQETPDAPDDHYLVVKPGMLRQQSWFGRGTEFYIPASAIAADAEDGVRLIYAAEELAAQGWVQPPANLQDFHRT